MDHEAWRPWARKAILGVSVALATLVAWNLVIDPFQVFDFKRLKRDSPTLNERFRKVDHLLKHPHDYDAFLVGSSTMGAIEPSVAESHFPGHRFYNLSMFAAQPSEILAVLKTFHAAGVPIRSVVYGIEPGPFHVARQDGPGNRPHYAVTGKNPARFWFDYVFASSPREGIRRIAEQFKSVPSIRYDIEGTGRYYLEAYEQDIALDPTKFMKEKLDGATPPPFSGSWSEEQFRSFAELVRWLREKKIEHLIYLNPLFPAMQAVYGEIGLSRFRERLRETAGLDFLPDCTHVLDAHAREFFYDLRHFRSMASQQIFLCAEQP